MTNMQLSHHVIYQLLASGVREFCLCAGARNSPFVKLFESNPQIKVYHFFEERSAAFFALGRIVATRHPVAVITTSGTAVAELLPAAVEGTYSSLPLILVTADRPKSYRGTGAPQSIEQVGIFTYYIESCFDLDADNTHFSLNGLSWKKPIHVNVCFSEPLKDGDVIQFKAPDQEVRTKFPESFPIEMVDQMHGFLETYHPIVILGAIPEKCREHVVDFLARLKAPIYAEAISGLRGHPRLKEFEIRSGERILTKLLDDKVFNAVFRIGGVPTVRLWRDLEDRRIDLPVFSLGYNHFTGLSREIPHFDDLEDLSKIEVDVAKFMPDNVMSFDQSMAVKAVELYKKYPRSEPGLVYHLSKLTSGEAVYLGNSLPIREWDLAADFDQIPLRVSGSRGANGIDGQVSTFLGWCKSKSPNWAILGDLTALYDPSALWVSRQMQDMKIRIVVLNNSGGMIFKRMFGKEIFLNRHDIGFEHWAKQWSFDFQKWQEVPSAPILSDRQIIEVSVCEKQTEQFWHDWDQVWGQ